MKRAFSLLALVVLVTGLVLAGQHQGPKAHPPKAVHPDDPVLYRSITTVVDNGTALAAPGDSIGFTGYDFYSNGGPCHNLINFGDGTLAIGRMASKDISASYTDRSTWYWYYNGTTWTVKQARVEATRVGWGNIDQFADFGGIEATVSHTGLRVNIDASKGAGSWTPITTNSTKGATWPRMATTGQSIHIVASATGGSGLFYTRSTDAGTTFDRIDSVVTLAVKDTLSSAPGSADAYDIAASGSKLAVLVTAEYGSVVLYLSTNNGTSWTMQEIFKANKKPAVGARQYVPDGSGSVIIDKNGNVHAVWSSYLTIGDTSSTGYAAYYSQSAPIRYWSQATGVKDIGLPTQDTTITTDAWSNGRDGNYSTYPDIALDANNNPYVVWGGVVSAKDDSSNNVEHLFGAASTNGGATWGKQVDLTPGTGFSADFPSIANLVDNYVHVVFNADKFSGNAYSGDHPQFQTSIRYLKIPKTAFTGIREVAVLPENYSLGQNYPNPFNPATKIQYSVPKATFVTLKVYDVLGREVATLVNQEQAAATYEVDFDASNLSNGAYFYKLQAGSFTDIKKMLLTK